MPRTAWHNRMHLRLIGLALLLGLVVLPSESVRAHPADMYSQSQVITLGSDGIQIEWRIAPGPVLADTVWEQAGADANGSMSLTAAQAWLTPFITDYSVTLGGHGLHASRIVNVHGPASVETLRTGEDTISVALVYIWPAGTSGKQRLEVHNGHFEPNSLNSYTLGAESGYAFDQPQQNNGLLDTTLYFPGTAGPAGALTSWTSGTPNLPDFAAPISSLALTLGNNGEAPAQGQQPEGGMNALTAALTGLVKSNQFTPAFLMGAFLLSMALGSLHALTPGHGKALVGAYLIGSQGRTRDAVFLGTVVTATHTGSVLLLGLVTLFASHFILPSLIAPWLEIGSGILVVGFGLNLLLQRTGLLHGFLPASHSVAGSQAPDPSHVHSDNHVHGHLHVERAHSHDHGHAGHKQGLASARVTFSSLLALGISGGLVPCPDAIAILLVAVAINRVAFGMLLIVSFSIGLAVVLITIGLAMVHGVRLVSRTGAAEQLIGYTPMVSAIVVIGLGAALTFSAWNSLEFARASLRPSGIQAGAAAMPRQTGGPAAVQRVLYVAQDPRGQDQLFVQRLPGSNPVRLTSEPSTVTGYSISPDGNTIAYTAFGPGDGTSILAIDSDGGNRRVLLECLQSECDFPRWYPDQQKLAYNRLDVVSDTALPRYSIWWLDIASGKTQPVFQDVSFASYAPEFSPDGKWLSYISAGDNTLVLYNLGDGTLKNIALGFHAPISETWSHSGKAVLFGGEASRDDWAPLHIKVYSLATGRITDLGGPGGASDYSAAWSPDGQWIAIDRSVPARGSSQNSNQIWLVRPDGTQGHMMLGEDGASYSSMSWTPDSDFLIYSRYTLGDNSTSRGRFDTYIADIRTGATKLLIANADVATFLP